jgi:hypothetical protein
MKEISMNVCWKPLKVVALSICILSLSPLSARAAEETVEGVIKGIRCVTDKICYSDKRDPRLSTESDFVLEQADGNYYYLFNIDRDTKLRFALDTVKVSGEVSERYQSIKADSMEVKQGNSFRQVWTPGRPYSPLRQPGATRR